MTSSASQLLANVRQALPTEDDNRLVPLLTSGKAAGSVLEAFAAEQYHLLNSDRGSFLALSERAGKPQARAFYAGAAQGEEAALARLVTFAAACGLDEAALRSHEPRAGCHAYPSYLAWLALHGEPVTVLLAVVADLGTWGRYCGTIAPALRQHYGLTDEACAFFDAFAVPAPQVEEYALAVIGDDLDDHRDALRYTRLLRAYESMFWNTLADEVA
ncbi:transcriptional regulator [Actinophytocola oryzae]|uniref:Thiaminase-2/PQQC domain-containing protein n=1 Tax=Actinophytocola oryzae TaxID=502181 RepID=A0A4V3FQ06_9PSEU|nr:transcriptional regulator [Actinophytocola oryzae]TDV34221.1 hypothetical protein CLV71_1413 [Actinophytocola oryzae]